MDLIEDLNRLIAKYDFDLDRIDIRIQEYKKLQHRENESYFMGQWNAIGTIKCDLQSLIRKHNK